MKGEIHWPAISYDEENDFSLDWRNWELICHGYNEWRNTLTCHWVKWMRKWLAIRHDEWRNKLTASECSELKNTCRPTCHWACWIGISLWLSIWYDEWGKWLSTGYDEWANDVPCVITTLQRGMMNRGIPRQFGIWCLDLKINPSISVELFDLWRTRSYRCYPPLGRFSSSVSTVKFQTHRSF